MRKLVIAVDCDDVLVATLPYFVAEYNRQFGTTVDLRNAHERGAHWGADDQTVLERFTSFLELDSYKALSPSDEERAALIELAKHHELHVITARRPEERSFTQYMLDRDFPGVFSSLELVGFTGSKGEVCRRLNATVVIDDNERHLNDAVKHGVPEEGALLFGEYPWNTPAARGRVRCKDWPSVVREVTRLATV